MNGSKYLLTGEDGPTWDRARMNEQVRRFRDALRVRRNPQAPVAVLADNSPEWIAIDLATQELDVPMIPLPAFFTPEQWMHAIKASGAGAIFTMQDAHARILGFTRNVPCDSVLSLHEADECRPDASLRGIQKITFTSGTTSQPKGVCLAAAEQWDVADAIYRRIAQLGVKRHLCLLPLSVLLENIGGVYTGMLCGATIACPPLSETGLQGASRFDPHACLDAIRRYEAHSIILLPQMLQALVAAAKSNDERISSLKFAAVGGAKTPVSLIQAARDKGFPVYEGYGLSECASVVALNAPGMDRIGSAGMPLPSRELRIAQDREIEVRVSGRIHYLGEAPSQERWLPSGDVGHLDAEGFLHIEGRKKNILITSFGRNVSPEWPESLLLGTGIAAQVIVLGDARPYLIALIVPASPGIADERIQEAVEQANAALPDYASIQGWTRVEPFTSANAQATANGRLRRAPIYEHYRQRINAIYEASGVSNEFL
jgi:long-chain acyl-CoA synthetase